MLFSISLVNLIEAGSNFSFNNNENQKISRYEDTDYISYSRNIIEKDRSITITIWVSWNKTTEKYSANKKEMYFHYNRNISTNKVYDDKKAYKLFMKMQESYSTQQYLKFP